MWIFLGTTYEKILARSSMGSPMSWFVGIIRCEEDGDGIFPDRE